MRFSIIIPALNEASTIQSCLLGLQSIRNRAEIILVDGGSTDNTLELAESLVDITIISAKGRAIQMNTGAEIATGDILVFLHADTFLPYDALELLNQAINSENKHWGRFDIQLRGTQYLLKVIATLMNWRSRITGIATGDQVIFVNKTLFDSIGGYPDIALMEDICICTTLKKISPPICLGAKVSSSGRRWEKNGVFKTILLMWCLRLQYFLGARPETLSILYSRGKFWIP